MKHALKLTGLLLILFFCPGCENNGNESIATINNADKDKLRFLKEVEWPKAYAEQDTLLLSRILDEDFQMIDQDGNWYTKQDELEWIKKNAANYDSFHFEIKRFDILDNGTAIICGTGHILNDSVKSIYQSSNILVKREGEWKAVLSHVSGIKKVD